MAKQATQTDIPIFGEHDSATIAQIRRSAEDERVAAAALMADGHLGYASMPIGGVLAYRDTISPSGVGFDIGCGNDAVLTNLKASDVVPQLAKIMDEIVQRIAFGIGRSNKQEQVHDPLFSSPLWKEIPYLKDLKKLAREQLGTVGSGNHYVNIFQDEQERIWVGVHFGSRGFGHKVASGFMSLAAGHSFNSKPKEGMDSPPIVFPLKSSLGELYWHCMNLAGAYAKAGRAYVINQVVAILGAEVQEKVSNHHNFAWKEQHNGEELIVIRKGSTPSWPGQRSFVGGSMGDPSVILRGKESAQARQTLYSTVHGAGRVLSRSKAAGRRGKPGLVSPEMMKEWVQREGVLLRGGGLDESPHVYRRLVDVLTYHADTVEVEHWLKPLGVAMAGADVYDPYKD
jgi:tRNA-splicing ligase RtcB